MSQKKKQTNDEIIFQLKKEVELKKSQLEKSVKFTPITNCVITLDSIKYNLNVCSLEDLQLLFVRLSLLQKENSLLFPEKPLIISGFLVSQWLEDINNKYNCLNIRTEQNKLKTLEDKLYMLLSQDSKASLELEEIKKSLQ